MKNLFLFVSLCLLFASCKVYSPGRPPVTPSPFVYTQYGRLIPAKDVELKKGDVVADGKVIDQKDVYFYSDGIQTFANVGNYGFAPRIFEGKINVYEASYEITSYSSGYGGIPARVNTSSRKRWYIQDSATDEVSFFNYTSLNKLIPPQSPAGIELKKFKRTRSISGAAFAASFGMLLSGAIIAGVGDVNDNNRAMNAGLYTMAASVGVLTYAVAIRGKHGSMMKALSIHNGILKPEQEVAVRPSADSTAMPSR